MAVNCFRQRQVRTTAAFGALALLTLVACAQDKAEKLSLKDIQGRWQVVFAAKGGEQRDRKQCLAMNLVFEIKEDAYTLTAGGRVIEKGKLSVNVGKAPVEVDQQIVEGTDKGKKQLGVMRKQKGTLEWCVGPAGGGRAKEFDSPKGSRNNFIQLERPQK
jgi:uncharacterized protein (TIGR03067 family)